MEQQRSTSSERMPAGPGRTGQAASPLADGPTRLETAVVLGILLIGVTASLMLYGRQILAMLGILWRAFGGGE